MIGCCLSNEEKDQKRVNNKIERQLIQDKKTSRRELKVLVQGTEDSGQRSFLNSLAAAHGQGYEENEQKEWRIAVFQVIFQAIQALCRALERLDIPLRDPNNIAHARLVLDIKCETVSSLDKTYLTAIGELWRDYGIQEAYNKRRELQGTKEFKSIKSAGYFLDKLETISTQGYIPNLTDISMAQTLSNSIIEQTIVTDYGRFRIIDISSQWTNRRKWIHYFEDVTVVVFFVGLESEYKNRFEQSISLFKATLEYPQFQSKDIILLLNQIDVFDETISHTDFADYFTDYTDPRFVLERKSKKVTRTDRLLAKRGSNHS